MTGETTPAPRDAVEAIRRRHESVKPGVAARWPSQAMMAHADRAALLALFPVLAPSGPEKLRQPFCECDLHRVMDYPCPTHGVPHTSFPCPDGLRGHDQTCPLRPQSTPKMHHNAAPSGPGQATAGPSEEAFRYELEQMTWPDVGLKLRVILAFKRAAKATLAGSAEAERAVVEGTWEYDEPGHAIIYRQAFKDGGKGVVYCSSFQDVVGVVKMLAALRAEPAPEEPR